MSNDKLHTLLQQLQAELKQTEALDPSTKTMLSKLDTDINQLLEAETQEPSLSETATLLEARFATEHPVAEAIMRNIIDTLAKMGI